MLRAAVDLLKLVLGLSPILALAALVVHSAKHTDRDAKKQAYAFTIDD